MLRMRIPVDVAKALGVKVQVSSFLALLTHSRLVMNRVMGQLTLKLVPHTGQVCSISLEFFV